LGAAALCWALWISRNDIVFNRSKPNSCLQVIFRGAYWIRCCRSCQKRKRCWSWKEEVVIWRSLLWRSLVKMDGTFWRGSRISLSYCVSETFLYVFDLVFGGFLWLSEGLNRAGLACKLGVCTLWLYSITCDRWGWFIPYLKKTY
jgi:hypothetical protein